MQFKKGKIMTKKVAIGLLLALGLSTVLAACNGGDTTTPEASPEATTEAPVEAPAESPAASPSP
jgi:hypothetical protein